MIPSASSPSARLCLLELPDGDHHGNAAGESRDHRVGNEFDEPPEPERTDEEEKHPGHHGGQRQPLVAVVRGNGEENGDERPGGPADLHKAAAERGDEEAGNDGGPKPLAGGDAGSDAEADGQRQRNDADGDPGDHVRQKHLPTVAAQSVK